MVRHETYTAFDTFASRLTDVRTAVLTTHINPDCDGLGSQLALSAFLRSRGIEVRVLNHQAVPPPYRFLDPGTSTLQQYNPGRDDTFIRTADMVVVVDTNHPDRLGSVAGPVRDSSGTKVIIDHHLDPDGFADVVISDDGACATGEIMYRLLEHAGGPALTAEVATALYAAIMTDTGSFRFPKTDADVHRIIAQLIEAGADPSGIYAHIYEQGSANRLQLLGTVLAGLQIHLGGRVCVMTVTQKMFRETGTSEIDTDMFVTYGLSIDGVRVSIMVTELPDTVKLNVRSKGAIPANEIARAFGGNGHLNAAGARMEPTPIPALLPRILDVIKHYLDQT